MFAVLLIAALVAAPPLIERKVRSSLSQLEGGYDGHIDRAELRFRDAEVVLHGLRIVKSNGKVPVPFLRAEELAIGFVFERGALRNTLRALRPQMSYVDSPHEARTQWGPNFDLKSLREKLPFELERVVLTDGQVHLRDFDAKPPLDVYARDLNVTFDRLSHCLPGGDARCDSVLDLYGTLMTSGAVRGRGTFKRTPESVFVVNAKLNDMRAEQLSPLLTRYVKINLEGGRIDLDARYTKRGETKRARLVPRLHDVEVLGNEEHDGKLARELAAAAAAHYFERRSGKKAITFEKHGKGKGNWELVDIPEEAAREPDDTPREEAREARRAQR